MKTMKLNLLEKKEMIAVRGGEPVTECSDSGEKCIKFMGQHGWEWNTTSVLSVDFAGQYWGISWKDRPLVW